MSELTLVTGANGFLALHIIHRLLNQNHPVRATLRDLAKSESVIAALRAHHTEHLDQLSFVQADLLKDADWPRAMAGVTHVMSVAAPVFVSGEAVTATLVQTAKIGTLRLLHAAEAAGVKRVVMTANFGAVGFSNHSHRTTTEADWTAPDEPGLSPYELSKLQAERAAWDFARTSRLELATVAAGAMLGPAMDDHFTGSFNLVRQLLAGSRFAPNVRFVISDVRDVAAVHVAALFADQAAGQRFLAVEDDSISLPEMVALIRRERPQLAARLPRRTLPAWVIRLAAPFSQTAREGRLFMRISHRVSNQNARTRLGWTPISSAPQAVLATVDALSRQA